jgi:hypothetical protein
MEALEEVVRRYQEAGTWPYPRQERSGLPDDILLRDYVEGRTDFQTYQRLRREEFYARRPGLRE